MPITAASPEHFIFPFRRAMLRFLWVCIPTVMPYPLPMTEMKPDSHCELRHCPATFPREVVAVTPTIYNENGEYLQIKGDILTGDVITVTTRTGNKTVTLTRNGVDSNILNRLVSGSTWLTLKEGTNTFRVEAVRGVEKLRVTLMHRNSYLGV